MGRLGNFFGHFAIPTGALPSRAIQLGPRACGIFYSIGSIQQFISVSITVLGANCNIERYLSETL